MSGKLIFADGTQIDNLIIKETGTIVSPTEITPEMLNESAMKTVKLIMTEDGSETETVYQYAKTNGAFRKEDGWHIYIWGANSAEIEMNQLREENEMLTECILEMSEIIYGE